MHELAIAESLVAAVVDKTGEQRVTTVRLSLGRLGGVVADALTFSFEIATLGTTLEGATLEIEAQPGRRRAATAARPSPSTTSSCSARAAVPMSMSSLAASCRSCPWR